MRILRVGDIHAQVGNLDETEALMQFVLKQAAEHNVDLIEILGDIFHTHSVIRMEVLSFWLKWLKKLSLNFGTIVLVGNHDQLGDYKSELNALEVFKNLSFDSCKFLAIVDKPIRYGQFGYLPYTHDHQEFVNAANKLYDDGARAIVCHATFDGAAFENGMYAPGGIDPNLLLAPLIISGHVHSRQRFGKVIYPGTPRWLTASDKNQPKSLWLADHAEDGSIVKEEFIDTSVVCKPIIGLIWKEGGQCPAIDPNTRTTIELIGSSDWIKKQKPHFVGNCSIKTTITDSSKPRVRRTGRSLSDFVNTLFETTVDKTKLLEYMKGAGLV